MYICLIWITCQAKTDLIANKLIALNLPAGYSNIIIITMLYAELKPSGSLSAEENKPNLPSKTTQFDVAWGVTNCSLL